MTNGILSYIAQGGSPVGRTMKRYVDTARGVADFRSQMAQLQEFKKGTSTRAAKRKLEKTQAEQENELLTQYGDLISETKVKKLESELTKMERQGKQEELIETASVFYGIEDEDQFQQVVKNVPKKTLKRFDIKPEEGLEGNRETIDYISNRALHDIEQLQRLELAGVKSSGDMSGMPALAKLQRARDIALAQGRQRDATELQAQIDKNINQADTAWRNVLGPITDHLVSGKKVPEGLKDALRVVLVTKEGPFDIKLMQTLRTVQDVLGMTGIEEPVGGEDDVIDLTQ